MIEQLQVQSFMNLFTGSKHNYGEHIYSDVDPSTGKEKGTSKTITNKLITIEEYRNHLDGKKGLGVIPINEENNKCRFAVIDVDIYDINYNVYISAIERNNFPLVPFKSKSGGLHLYLFFSEESSAIKAKEIIKTFSSLLSIDILVKRRKNESVEIFPKQSKLGKGQIGNWINLPYFNAGNTKSPALRNGKELSLNEALVYIKEKQTNIKDVTEFLEDLQFNDAPPCLQRLNLLNILEENSGRNNYLFSFGVFFKKKDENFFEQNLKELNLDLLKPIPEKELQATIISSLNKRDYVYKCKENPLVDFCDKKLCRKREFGVGKDGGYFSSIESGKLYQFKTSQPYYEWEVRLQGQENFVKLRFKSEEEIIKQDAFLKLCMRELYELPSKLKQSEWFVKVNQALKEIEIVTVDEDDDISEYTLLKNLIIEFLTSRSMAEKKDQIFAKRVYFEQSSKEYYFRVKDLSEYIFVLKGFKYFNPRELHGILKEWNCKFKVLKTESGKTVRVAFFNQDDLKVNMEDKEVFVPDFSKYQDSDF